jgi:PAS domain S-box-containing protein
MNMKSHRLAGYLFAVTAVAVAFLLREGLIRLTGGSLPTYITFYPAVMLSALIGGVGPGFLATAAAALGVDYFILPPTGAFAVATLSDAVGLAFFTGMGVFMSVVAELYRRARQKAVAYEMEGLLRDRLETPVHWTKQGVLLNAGLVVSLLILAAAGWQSARSLRAVAASDQWVTHSQNVILELDGLISALKDEETGQRGYLLTGEDEYLEPYQTGLGLVQSNLASLKQLALNNAAQQQRLAGIEVLILEKEAELKQTIALRRSQSLPAALEVVRSDKGKALMDQIRKAVADAQSDEERLLHERVATRSNDTVRTLQAVLAGGVLAFLLLVTVFLFLKQENIRATKAESEVRHHRGHLQEMVDARTEELRRSNDNLKQEIHEHQQAKEALRLSEEKFSTAFAGNPAAITITRLEDGLFLDVNETWEALNGYGRGEALGLSAREIGIWPTDSARQRFVQELTEKGSLRGWEQEFHKKSGEIFVAQLSAQVLTVHGEKVILSTLVDITERKRKEEELGRLNRTLKALHESNRAMTSALDEPQYLQAVCQIAVQVCGHAMVWIGFAENDEAKSVVPAAWAGRDDGYIKALCLTWADTERGRGPTGAAIRTGKPRLCRDMRTDPAIAPWRQLALEHGYASSLALPLLADGRAFGAVTIYSPQPDSFSESEVMLLSELAEELAQGITTRRLRAERARVEEQLRLLSSAVEAAVNGIALTDRGGKILWINPAFTRLTGYSLQEAVGQNPRVLKSGKHPAEFYAQMWATIVRGESWSGELVNRRKDGSLYTEQMTIAPVRASGAGVTHFVAIKQDISARKRAEDRTRLMAETVGQLLKSDSPQHIAHELCESVMDYLDCEVFFNFLVDEQPDRLRLNGCAGVSEEQAAKLQWLDFGAGVSGCVARDKCRIVAENILSTPDPRTELVKAVGLQAYACHPLMAEGRLIGTLSFGAKKRPRFTDDELSLMKDVADQVAIALQRQNAQAALRHTALELERSNQELQQFAYVASHDLQEPLRAVAGYLGLIDERLRDKLDDKGRHYMAGAIEGAERMHTLINDLLELSRVGSRGGEFQSADLNAVLDIALKNLAVTVNQTNAVVTRSSLPALPADANQIAMLFQNLIGNAIKFRGERPPEIDVSARWQAGHWVFAVRDNGIGIEPQYYEQIFQIFRRLHTRKQYPGTGIGLAICKKIVERHGGRIWVQSQPGLGSTFLFTIPDQRP